MLMLLFADVNRTSNEIHRRIEVEIDLSYVFCIQLLYCSSIGLLCGSIIAYQMIIGDLGSVVISQVFHTTVHTFDEQQTIIFIDVVGFSLEFNDYTNIGYHTVNMYNIISIESIRKIRSSHAHINTIDCFLSTILRLCKPIDQDT
jgi:hypothetical protein